MTKIDETLAVAVVDCETTGLDPETDRIVELAVVETTLKGTVHQASNLYNPGKPVPPEASAIHHIVDEDVKDCQVFTDRPSIMDHGIYAAHNAEFDRSFIKWPGQWICTMRLAQKLWPHFESFGNQYLRYRLKLDCKVNRNEPMHRALPDALVTSALLIRELETVLNSLDVEVRENVPNNTVEELIAWIEKPKVLTTVRFGKHKGLSWDKVPRDYLSWILKSMGDADRDTLFTANYYLSRR